MLQPDLGTTITLCLMLLGVSSSRARPPACHRHVRRARGRHGRDLARALPPRRLFSFVDPWQDAQGAGSRPSRRSSGSAPAASPGQGSATGVQKIFYLPEATRT
jgi:cell division protein FtsW (lipid II flippase)